MNEVSFLLLPLIGRLPFGLLQPLQLQLHGTEHEIPAERHLQEECLSWWAQAM